MPFSTYVGDTGRVWKFQLAYSDGSHPNISGFNNSNIVLRMTNGTTPWTLTGGIQVFDGINAIFYYQPTSTDVATAGNFTIQPTVDLPNGPTTFPTDTVTVATKI